MLKLRITLVCLMHLFITGLLLIMFPLQAAAATVEVRAEDDHYITYAFIPSEVTVSVGDTVTWKKGFSDLPHSIFGDATTKDYYGNSCANGFFNGVLLKPGATFSFTFNSAGDCNYQCIMHPPDMLGVIHVVAGGHTSSTSSTTPIMAGSSTVKEPHGSSGMNEAEQKPISEAVGKSFRRPSILEQKPSDEEKPTEKAIRANKFELVDGKGKVRAVLGMTSDDEPRLALADRTGQIQAMLSVEPVPGHPDGIPTLRLLDKAGMPRTDISLSSDGNPVITLRNKNGGHLASLAGSEAAGGGAEWLLSDKDSKIRVELRVNDFGTNLFFLDKDRKPRARFGLKPNGSPVFVFLDVMGEEEAVPGSTGIK